MQEAWNWSILKRNSLMFNEKGIERNPWSTRLQQICWRIGHRGSVDAMHGIEERD